MSESKYQRAEKLRADGRTWREVAAAMDVTRRTVYRWRSSGKLQDPQEHKQNGGPSVALDGTSKGNGDGDTTLSAARLRKQQALAEKHELDLAERRGELVPRDAQRDIVVRFRSAIEAAPRALLPEIAEILDVPQREAHPVLERIADRIIEHTRATVEKWVKDEAERRGLEVEDD